MAHKLPDFATIQQNRCRTTREEEAALNEYLVKTFPYEISGCRSLPDPAQIHALLNRAVANRLRLEQMTTCTTNTGGCLYLVFRNMGNASPID